MWKLNIDNQTTSSIQFSDGMPVDTYRGGIGETYRLMVVFDGYIDIVDLSNQLSEFLYLHLIYFNNLPFYWLSSGPDTLFDIRIRIMPDHSFVILPSANGAKEIEGHLKNFPDIAPQDVVNFKWMVQQRYVPYQNIPDEPGKSVEEIRRLGRQYFPFSGHSFELAMSLYDWTTADFTRITFFRIFQYCHVSGLPLDLESIATSIWTANWPPYTPHDEYYMNSFMMKPASNLEEVKMQLRERYSLLYRNNESEINIIRAALFGMPKTSIHKVPALYSGQVDVSNLGTAHFAAYFKEFPYNSDSNKSLEMPLSVALKTFINIGKPLTLKSPMAFTDSLADAMHYSNGIVLVVKPKNGSICWDHTAYITPLSDGPDKTEYLFLPDTSFIITGIETILIKDKPIAQITLEL